MACLMDLPNEILKEIIDRIDSFNDKLAFCFVNRRLFNFNKELFNPKDYDNIIKKAIGFDKSERNKMIRKNILSHQIDNDALLILHYPINYNLLSMISRLTHLKSLVIKYEENDELSGLYNLTNLENLILSGSGLIRMSELNALTNLSVLSLDVDVLFDVPLTTSSLKVIKFSKFPDIFNDVVNPFANLALESLSLEIFKSRKLLYSKQSNYTCLTSMTTLKALSIIDQCFDSNNMSQLCAMTQLSELEIMSNWPYDILSTNTIPCKITYLNVEMNSSNNLKKLFDAIENVSELHTLRVQILRLRGNYYPNTHNNISISNTRIINLTIIIPDSIVLECNNIMKNIKLEATNVTINTIGPLESMQSLSIKANSLKVSMNHFSSIMVLNLNLKEISVDHIDQHSDLKCITINVHRRIKHNVVKKITKITSLRELSLVGCLNISDDFECLSKLTKLRLLRVFNQVQIPKWTKIRNRLIVKTIY